MGQDTEIKNILDSVHGQIKIPKEWCDKIIDTPYFQRLRRIEQNSCRSVFPSARHDRFIHSLGVYHIGTLIASHLENQCEIPEFEYSILDTYKLACLLHDVGHTPFSHTFEEYFNEPALRKALSAALDDEMFDSDLGARATRLTEHELLSAYIAVSVFKGILSNDDIINWPLLARMIIGLPYVDASDRKDATRFENIMIELIHGTIDADGLDYVCRDVWAGGYHNFAVDLHRLIDAIIITKQGENYRLAFSAKAINEIESVLNIKNFQFLYVFNHHKVLLEQLYLVEAMKSASVYHMDIQDRKSALEALCNYRSYMENIVLPKIKYNFFRPCDDDFIALMKQSVPFDDVFIRGWFERRFQHKPLWKSKIHFFHSLSDLLYDIKVPIDIQRQNNTDAYLKKIRNTRIETICQESCKKEIIKTFGLEESDIFQIAVTPKIRKIGDEIYIALGEDVKKFTELSHDSFTVTSDLNRFCYWYVNLDKIQGDDNYEIKRCKIIDEIKEVVLKLENTQA